MAKDFATRTNQITEETQYIGKKELDSWESKNHACLFFNSDKQHLTFFGFSIDDHKKQTIDMKGEAKILKLQIDPKVKDILQNKGINLNENFNDLER